MDNLIVWADIPVTDLDRAMKFYGAVLQRPFVTMEGMEGSRAAGSRRERPGRRRRRAGHAGRVRPRRRASRQKPSQEGCTIYLESGGDAQGMLQRAADAGGEILSPAAFMGEMVGTIGFFRDSEGNRIGVHQQGQAS